MLKKYIFRSLKFFSFTGYLSYWDENGKAFLIDIESFGIQSEDSLNKQIQILQNANLNIFKFHTGLMCSFEVDLVMQLEKNHSLQKSLIKASVIPIDPVRTDLSPRFFALSDELYNFDGTVLEVKSTCAMSDLSDVTVYSK